MWYMHEGIGWWMVFGGVWMIAFWGGLIALIVWGVMKLGRRDNSTSKHDLLNVAMERYAKGEIHREEFNKIKKDLS